MNISKSRTFPSFPCNSISGSSHQSINFEKKPSLGLRLLDVGSDVEFPVQVVEQKVIIDSQDNLNAETKSKEEIQDNNADNADNTDNADNADNPDN